MSESFMPPAPKAPYAPDAVILYGTALGEAGKAGTMQLDLEDEGTATISLGVEVGGDGRSMAVVFAYAFDGQCQRFERPRVLAFEGEAEDAEGCGFDEGGYTMWRVSRLSQVVEIDLQAGSLQDTLQDIHEADERGPATYGSKFQMMHRHKAHG